MARVALIGDVGGCAGQLDAALRDLATDPDTVVVQVGDLVDRGPDSPGVLALVGEQLARRPRRWVQLAGNHESQYFGGFRFWPEQLAESDAATLRTWWLREQMQVAAAVRAADGEEFLVTHAGLSVDAWRELGEPVTARTAAGLLNTRPDKLIADMRGPLWVESGTDLYEDWLRGSALMPFSQIHGHSSVVSYRDRQWRCGERIRSRSTVDWTARHTITRAGAAARFIGIDPKHGTSGAPAWSPFILPGATIL